MTDIFFLQIVGAVLLGNGITFISAMCLHRISKSEQRGWAILARIYFGAALAPLFMAAMVYTVTGLPGASSSASATQPERIVLQSADLQRLLAQSPPEHSAP